MAWLAVLFWLLRSSLSSMDVPARESYTMSVVRPDERVAMASMYLTGRNTAGAVGPSVATLLWNAFSAGAPFIACGVVKIGYDLALFALFRNLKAPQEQGSKPPGP